jgi:hypothetical protein
MLRKIADRRSSLFHSNVMEESMTTPRRLSLALGLALAIPAAAYAYDGGSPPSHHHYRRPYHGRVAYRAPTAAPALVSAPNVGFWPPSYTTSHEQYEIEGLTRNPDDCVIYGCIGNN